RLEHGHLGAEPAERLRQLEPDRAGADHDQMPRTLGQIEHGFVGEMRRVGEARDRRRRRRRAGRNDQAPRPDRAALAARDGPPIVTVVASWKRAAPSITRTPRPVKRSFESFGSIAAMTRCTWSCTALKSIRGGSAVTPNAVADAIVLTCLAAAIIDFDGTQPK